MTLFTKIINSEIPGNFIWADDHCVVFTTIEPCSDGHVLVVPRMEVDNFIDAPAWLVAHLFQVAQIVGRSCTAAFNKERAAIIVAGFDVPHLHIHVIPANGMADLDLAKATSGQAQQIRLNALRLRQQLVKDGHADNVPKDVDSPKLGA